MRVGPKDGHATAWRRRFRGEEGHADTQVPAEHISLNRSPSVWHAGELSGKRYYLYSFLTLKEIEDDIWGKYSYMK